MKTTNVFASLPVLINNAAMTAVAGPAENVRKGRFVRPMSVSAFPIVMAKHAVMTVAADPAGNAPNSTIAMMQQAPVFAIPIATVLIAVTMAVAGHAVPVKKDMGVRNICV
ncbi:MAG: hypothetical protein J6A01_10400 [Proteobacteria bacterium]|nr:hypothetical protein [Pseudomonadota bacterium]